MKKLKDWLDEFVQNGANPNDITKWPMSTGGVQVLPDLPSTGKDGDLVLVKKERVDGPDVSNVNFEIYGNNGAMLLVDKEGIYTTQTELENAIKDYLTDFFGIYRSDVNVRQPLTLDNFNSGIESGEIIVLNSREDAIGKYPGDQGKFFLKIGTAKLKNLKFIESPRYSDPDSEEETLSGIETMLLFNNSFDFFQHGCEYKNGNIQATSYGIEVKLNEQGNNVYISKITSTRAGELPVYRVLEKGEFYDFLDNEQQTAEWKSQSQSQGYGMFALMGELNGPDYEPEYDYAMYVYYDEKYNLIPTGEEKELEGSQLLPFVRPTFNQLMLEQFFQPSTNLIKIKSLDAIVELLKKYNIPMDLPFVETHTSGSCSVSIGPITIVSDGEQSNYNGGIIFDNFYNREQIVTGLITSDEYTLETFLETNRNAIEEAIANWTVSYIQFAVKVAYYTEFLYIRYSGFDGYSDTLYHTPINKMVKAQEIVDLFELVDNQG